VPCLSVELWTKLELDDHVIRALFFQRLSWKVSIILISLLSAGCGILAPYFQKRFADDLLKSEPDYAGLVFAFLAMLGAHGFLQVAIWLANRESIFIQNKISNQLYTRLLQGPGALVGKRPPGEAISLFAVDVPGAAGALDQALVMALGMFFPLVLAPFVLHYFFGIPFHVSVFTLFLLTAINFILARRQSLFFYSFKTMASERTAMVSEWIQNIRTLRILGWVKSIENKIFKIRERETKNRVAMVTNGQLMNSIATSATYFLNAGAILYFVHLQDSLGKSIAPSDLLSLLWIMGVFLQKPLRQFPWAIVIGMDSISSIRRLEQAMALPVGLPEVVGGHAEGKKDSNLALDVGGIHLELDGKVLLDDLDFQIKAGEWVAIVGEVGSGKSLLLKSLLGVMPATYTHYSIFGKSTQGPIDPNVSRQFAFVPQENFTISATLKENVLLSYLEDDSTLSPHLDQSVERSLKLSGFVWDILAEIGEKGVNLSGGQRQRINIARAHHSDRKIIFLDDCLSAVDVDTEKHLIEELLSQEWKSHTRILVTHRMSVLPYCDRILFMENGKMSYQGGFRELCERVPRFREFIQRENEPTLVSSSHRESTMTSSGHFVGQEANDE
jgi:ATP-binding cassette subfamily B multidrug efflux pump